MLPENDDAFARDDTPGQWQLDDWRDNTAAPAGGGLLQTILQELTALRGEVASLRRDLDGLRATVVESASIDVRPQVSEVLSNHREVLAGDVAAAVGKHLDALREALPSDHLARVASQVAELRVLLVGSA